MPTYSPSHCKYCKATTHKIDNCPDVICLKCRRVGHPHWRCTGAEQPSEQKKKTKTYKQNIFDLLDESDSDSESVSTKPSDLNNLTILNDLVFSTQPWGDIGK